jgi:2-desacetyl-2-hydroxyethyl bacteriochlorophyllide A dehydrogenase
VKRRFTQKRTWCYMWTSTLYLEPKRILLSKFLGLFYPDIYYTSLAPLQVENIPRQQLPASNWVRVRNRLAGICGSDLHLVRADGDLRVAPAALPGNQELYPGHEVVGEVIEIGDDVQHLQVGDRVVLQRGPNCISKGIHPLCRACADGEFNLCEQGDPPVPAPIGGGWSEEMLLHEQQLFLLPENLSDEQGVLIEPAAVALHAVLRRPPRPGERVLIIGAGTIGLLTLQVIRALAPQAEVSVQVRHTYQVEQATRLGAAQIIYPKDRYTSVQRITKGRMYQGLLGNRVLQGGFDVIYDTVGGQTTLHDSLRWTRAGGSIVLIGVNLHAMKIDLTPLWYREIDIFGSTAHGLEIWPIGSNTRRETFGIVAEMMQQELIHTDQLITHRFALNNYREALVTATGKARSQAIKVAFDYALQPATTVPNVRASGRRRYPLVTGGQASSSSPYESTGEQEQQALYLSPTVADAQPDNEPWQQYAQQDEENQANNMVPGENPYGGNGSAEIEPTQRASQDRTMPTYAPPAYDFQEYAAPTEAMEVLGNGHHGGVEEEDDSSQPTTKFTIPPHLRRGSTSAAFSATPVEVNGEQEMETPPPPPSLVPPPPPSLEPPPPPDVFDADGQWEAPGQAADWDEEDDGPTQQVPAISPVHAASSPFAPTESASVDVPVEEFAPTEPASVAVPVEEFVPTEPASVAVPVEEFVPTESASVAVPVEEFVPTEPVLVAVPVEEHPPFTDGGVDVEIPQDKHVAPGLLDETPESEASSIAVVVDEAVSPVAAAEEPDNKGARKPASRRPVSRKAETNEGDNTDAGEGEARVSVSRSGKAASANRRPASRAQNGRGASKAKITDELVADKDDDKKAAVAKIGGSVTNGSVPALPKEDELSAESVKPKPRPRRKKAKPSE